MPKQIMKRVEKKDLKVGLKVVVNSLLDTYIYDVEKISQDGLSAELTYVSAGTKYNAGWMPYGCMYYPSKEQLAHHEKHYKA